MSLPRRRFLKFSAFLTLGIMGACRNQTSPEQPNYDCRWVNHSKGKTCVPRSPQRILLLGSTALESALAMGVNPLASQTDVLPHLQDRLDGITILGWPLNLEKVTALNPDLIIGSADGEEAQTYELLSQIAPTVLADLDTSGDWKQMVRFVGEVLGQPEAAKGVLDKYDQRIDQFKREMKVRAENLEISVIRLYPEKITLYQKDSFIGRILDDAGLKRPPSQQLSADQALAFADNPIQTSISKELLEKADGDVIFVITYSYHKQRERELKTRLEKLKTDPLWSRLEAVQRDGEHRVYPVGSHWIVSGALAAHAVIDDLFRYLIKEKS